MSTPSASDSKVHTSMSKEERTEHDARQREREQAEQAGECSPLRLWLTHQALPYQWSQELNTVTVNVPLPPGTRAKNLDVVMTPKKLKVKLFIARLG